MKSAPRRTIGPVRRGQWVDYVLHVKFSRNAGSGFVEAWENGKQTVQRTNRGDDGRRRELPQAGHLPRLELRGTVALTMDGLRVTAP